MADKPKAVFMARAELVLFCECGGRLTRTSAGTFLCEASGCRWKDRELVAVTMQAAPMYEA